MRPRVEISSAPKEQQGAFINWLRGVVTRDLFQKPDLRTFLEDIETPVAPRDLPQKPDLFKGLSAAGTGSISTGVDQAKIALDSFKASLEKEAQALRLNIEEMRAGGQAARAMGLDFQFAEFKQNGSITPNNPNARRDEIIQIVVRDLDNRGAIMNTLEQRTSIKGQ